jgi:3-oxoacyl-[acyl-carrier protein] reductase
MVAQGSGRVIELASQLGTIGAEGMVHYCAAKAGVIGLTKTRARAGAERGAGQTIAPGPIETPMVGGISDEWKRAKEAELPLRRFSHAVKVAPSTALLASDPAATSTSGRCWGPIAAT